MVRTALREYTQSRCRLLEQLSVGLQVHLMHREFRPCRRDLQTSQVHCYDRKCSQTTAFLSLYNVLRASVTRAPSPHSILNSCIALASSLRHASSCLLLLSHSSRCSDSHTWGCAAQFVQFPFHWPSRHHRHSVPSPQLQASSPEHPNLAHVRIQ